MVNYMTLPTICRNLVGSGVGTKLDGSVQRSRDGLTVGHPEFEEHTQHIMALADQDAFGGTDHFDPEEVMKVHCRCVLSGGKSGGLYHVHLFLKLTL